MHPKEQAIHDAAAAQNAKTADGNQAPYEVQKWNYQDNPELLEKVFELAREKKEITVICRPGKDGIILIGDDYESPEQAAKVLRALNA